MKRAAKLSPILIPAILVAILGTIAALGQFSGPINITGNPASPPHYVIVASTAPGWMHSGGATVCTSDNLVGGATATIQAILDKAGDFNSDGTFDYGEKGIVQLGPGAYYLEPPVGQTVWSGSGHAHNDGNATRIDVDAFDGTFVIADVKVGHLVRLADGGAALTTLDDDQVFTVIAKTADSFTISTQLNAQYTTAKDVLFKRIVGCLNLPSQVALQGSGISATYLVLLDDTDYTAVTVEGWGTATDIPAKVVMRLANLQIRRKTAPVAADGDRNGLVISEGAIDFDLDNVIIQTIPGDGMVFNNGHASVVRGASGVESGWKHGIVLNPGDELRLENPIVESCKEDHIYLHRTARAQIQANGGLTEAGVYGLLARNAAECNIYGCNWDIAADTDPTGGFNLIGTARSTVYGNVVQSAAINDIGINIGADSIDNSFFGNTMALSGAGAQGFVVGSYWNSIIGNTVRTTGSASTAFVPTIFSGFNQMQGNLGQQYDDVCETVKMTNRNGGSITAGYLVARAALEAEADANEFVIASGATVASSQRLFGVLFGTTADNVVGDVQLYGYSGYCAVFADGATAIAVGDELCIDSDTDGALEEAAAGKYVVAIANEAQGAGAGVVFKKVTILRPGDRYTHP